MKRLLLAAVLALPSLAFAQEFEDGSLKVEKSAGSLSNECVGLGKDVDEVDTFKYPIRQFVNPRADAESVVKLLNEQFQGIQFSTDEETNRIYGRVLDVIADEVQQFIETMDAPKRVDVSRFRMEMMGMGSGQVGPSVGRNKSKAATSSAPPATEPSHSITPSNQSINIQGLSSRYEGAEGEAARLAHQLHEMRAGASPDKKGIEKLSEELRAQVKLAFATRMELQQAALDEAEANIKTSRQRLAQRHQLADQIIKRRVEELESGGDTSRLERVSTPPMPTPKKSTAFGPAAIDISTQSAASSNAGPQSTGMPILKTNIRNSVRAETTHPSLESIISVGLTGDEDIDWLFSEEPLKREPLGFSFNLDNVSGPSIIDFIDGQGRSISSFVRMECEDAPARFWEQIKGVSVEIHVSHEDFEQVLAKKIITKVVFLPNDQSDDSPANLETLVSYQMAPGTDVLAEARRRGQPVVLFGLRPRSAADVTKSLR